MGFFLNHPDYKFATVTCLHCGEQLSVPTYCGNRFCSVCNAVRCRLIRAKLDAFVSSRTFSKAITFKHLTLTIKSEIDLKNMVEFILASFRRLRQRRLWRDKVLGGAFVIELAKNNNAWHAHLHIIIESHYVPWKDLLEDWESITGSTGVFIKWIPVTAITRYLTKYVTKSELDEADQVHSSEALRGKRLFQPFGTWHNGFGAIDSPKQKCNECGQYEWSFGDHFSLFHNQLFVPELPINDEVDSSSDRSCITVDDSQLVFESLLPDPISYIDPF